MSVLIGILTLSYVFLLLFLLFGFSKVPEFFGKSTAPKTTFSIVIPFRNEAENLPALFRSIEKLKYPPELFEVILVNDASEDASENLCREFIQANSNLNIQLLQNNRTSESPKKDAITTAVRKAAFGYILTTDADCEVPEKWLSEFDSKISESGAKMLAAPVMLDQKNGQKSSFLTIFQELDIFSLQAATIGGFGVNLPFMCNGANFCYEKKAFQEVHGFEGNDKIASGDDIFLLEKFRRKGLKTVFLKSKAAIVTTPPQPDLKSFFSQRIRWAAKTSAYKSFFGKTVGLLILLMNLMVVLTFLGTLSGKFPVQLFLFPFVLKFNVDFILIYNSAQFFEREKILKNYFWCSFIYPVLSSCIAIASLFSGYEWKDRRFKK